MNYHSFHFLAPAITLYAPTSVLEQDRWFHPGFSTCLSLCLNLSLLSYHPPSSSGSLSLWAQSSLNPAQVHPAFLSWSFWTFVSSIFFSTLYIVSYPRVLPFQLNVQLLGNGRPSGVTARQTVWGSLWAQQSEDWKDWQLALGTFSCRRLGSATELGFKARLIFQ